MSQAPTATMPLRYLPQVPVCPPQAFGFLDGGIRFS